MSTVDIGRTRQTIAKPGRYTSRRRDPPPVRRRPTYGAGTRLARIIYGLTSRPNGWSFQAIEDEIGISERTLLRYLAACRRDLIDTDGNPLLEIVRRGDRRLLRLVRGDVAHDASPYQVLSLYLALTVFQFLDGTVLKEGVEDLWTQFYRRLPASQQARLTYFDRKFFSVPYAPKIYRGDFDDILDPIVQCLVRQHRMRIDYLGGSGGLHEFDPYTLATYRGGLYLIGYSHRSRKIIFLAVERIRAVEKLPERFDYPAKYSPTKYTEGTFGIISGPETRVDLLILNEETVVYLRSRRIHPTQQFHQRRDGTTLLTMRVRGTTELAAWVLSFGPYMRVLRPRELRDEVTDQHERAALLYRRNSRGDGPGPAPRSAKR